MAQTGPKVLPCYAVTTLLQTRNERSLKRLRGAIRHLRTEIDPAAEMGHPNALNARDMDTSCEIAPAVTSM